MVVIDFPFSDLSQTKRRPALVVAALKGEDLILCQITSQAKDDEYAIRLDEADFAAGGLNRSSRIRPNRLFTADSRIVAYRAGRVLGAKIEATKNRLIQILREG